MASRNRARNIGAGVGAGITSAMGVPLVGSVLGGLAGGAIGKLFGSDEKKDPYEWYKQHPEEIPAGLERGLDPQKLHRNRYMFDLLGKYEQATQSAREANELRYRQLLEESGGLEDLYRGQKYVPMAEDDYDYGAAAKEEIEEERRYGQAESMAALSRQGLGGTTVLGSVIARHRKAAGQAKAAVKEGVQRYRTQRRDVSRRERMGFERQQLMDISRAREMRMGVIERREDIGPDPQMFSQMMGLYTARPGMFKTLTAKRRGKLEQIYARSGVGNTPYMT